MPVSERRSGQRYRPELTVSGYVELQGDAVFVNGMLLSKLIRQFTPPDTGEGRYERLVITVEDPRDA